MRTLRIQAMSLSPMLFGSSAMSALAVTPARTRLDGCATYLSPSSARPPRSHAAGPPTNMCDYRPHRLKVYYTVGGDTGICVAGL